MSKLFSVEQINALPYEIRFNNGDCTWFGKSEHSAYHIVKNGYVTIYPAHGLYNSTPDYVECNPIDVMVHQVFTVKLVNKSSQNGSVTQSL
jgi:hypothetical protein